MSARSDRGFALFAVMLFSVVVGITGIAFFSMASYEFRGAGNRQRSTEAFYLADGALETARGAFLEDRSWRGPIPETALGSGVYRLTVRDTTVTGDPAVVLRGEGGVGESSRGVEAVARVRPLLEVMPLFAGRDLVASAAIDLGGRAHVNGAADLGPGGVHLAGGSLDQGYSISPPPVFAGPDDFPDATFYRLLAHTTSPAVVGVYRYDRTTAGWVFADTTIRPPVVHFNSNPDRFTFDFDASRITTWFRTVGNGVFKLDNPAGDRYVVVDFGNLGSDYLADVELQSLDPSWELEATILNARFTGDPDPGDQRRVQACGGWWVGGRISLEGSVTMAPRGCVSMIAAALVRAEGSLGTPSQPALTVVTGTAAGLGPLEVHGAFISLCDMTITGVTTVEHRPGFLDCLPAGMLGPGGAGFLSLLQWKEVAVQ